MNRKLKENILNQIEQSKVGESFAYFVLGKIDLEDLYGYMDEYREHFQDYIKHNVLKDKYPTNTNDDDMNDKNKIEIQREIETIGNRSMIDLEQWMVNLKMTKDDWSEILDEVAR